MSWSWLQGFRGNETKAEHWPTCKQEGARAWSHDMWRQWVEPTCCDARWWGCYLKGCHAERIRGALSDLKGINLALWLAVIRSQVLEENQFYENEGCSKREWAALVSGRPCSSDRFRTGWRMGGGPGQGVYLFSLLCPCNSERTYLWQEKLTVLLE